MNYYKLIFCIIVSLSIIPMIHMKILLRRKQKELETLNEDLKKELLKLLKRKQRSNKCGDVKNVEDKY